MAGSCMVGDATLGKHRCSRGWEGENKIIHIPSLFYRKCPVPIAEKKKEKSDD